MRYLLPILILLAGCEQAGGAMTRTERTVTMIVIEWSKDPDAECRKIGAVSHATIGGCTVMDSVPCRVIARPPESWWDTGALAIIGHEFMHCLGWTHA